MIARTKYAIWGFLTYLSISLGLLTMLAAALIQQGIFHDFTPGGIPFSKIAVQLFFCFIALGFVFGWIALYFGRQLNCEVCNGQVLPADQFGFPGLRFQPTLNAMFGKNICSTCAKVFHP